MRTGIAGTVESIYCDIKPGDIIDVNADRAAIWIAQKFCEAVDPNTPVTGRLKDPAAHY